VLCSAACSLLIAGWCLAAVHARRGTPLELGRPAAHTLTRRAARARAGSNSTPRRSVRPRWSQRRRQRCSWTAPGRGAAPGPRRCARRPSAGRRRRPRRPRRRPQWRQVDRTPHLNGRGTGAGADRGGCTRAAECLLQSLHMLKCAPRSPRAACPARRARHRRLPLGAAHITVRWTPAQVPRGRPTRPYCLAAPLQRRSPPPLPSETACQAAAWRPARRLA